MEFYSKVIIAVCLIVAGTFTGVRKFRKYNSSEALTKDLLDLIFFLPDFIWAALLLSVGAGWLYHLLTST
jgi:hypothetical protein